VDQEQQQYEKICQPAFGRLELGVADVGVKVARLDRLLRGENGTSPGVTTRIAVLEDRVAGLVKACWVLFGVVVSIASAMIVRMLYGS